MTRVLFVGRLAQLAAERYERLGGEVADAGSAEVVVDVDAWGLADPVGICREELVELEAAVDARVAELPLAAGGGGFPPGAGGLADGASSA